MGYVSSPPQKFRRHPRGTSTLFGQKLRSLTGPVYATKTGTGCPRMTNAKYVESYHSRGRIFLDRQKVPHYLIQAHLEGWAKLKVSARHGLFTLLYFDLDTHAFGSPDDVRLMAQVVRQHFPTMPEFVFDERGGSGWLVVDTSGVSPTEYNRLVRRLEGYFSSVAEAMRLNVQFVEVKGRVYEHTFHAGRLATVKAGDLMKAPPSQMYLDQPPVEAGRFASGEFDPWPAAAEPADTRDDDEHDEHDDGEVPDSQSVRAGSFRPQLVTADIQARLPDLEQFVRTHFADRPVKAGRWSVSDRAFAEILITLVLLKPNRDGSNPYKRHRAFVEELYSQGVFELGYNHARYKVVRDYLSSKLAIHWQDETWRPGTAGQDGRACRWRLDPVLVEQVETVVGLRVRDGKEQDSTLVDTTVLYSGQHRVPRPELVVVGLPAGYEEAIAALFTPRWEPQLAA